MKHFLVILLLLLSCLLVFNQCHKADRCLGVIKLTDEARNMIPYKGGENLIFIDSTGDSVHYLVDKPVFSYREIEDPKSGNYYKCEICYISPFNISLGAWFPYDSPLQLIFGINQFTLKSHPEIIVDFSGQWIYNSGKLYQLKSYGWSGIAYYDTLTIVSKKFNSVYALKGWATSWDSSEVYRYIYYTIKQGIVGIKTSKGIGNGRTWYLN